MTENQDATPRPWHLGERGVNAAPAASRITSAPDRKFGHQVAMTYSSGTNPNGVADAALIVAAVNSFDAFRDLEAAAREVRDCIGPIRDEWNNTDELDALDAALARLDQGRGQ